MARQTESKRGALQMRGKPFEPGQIANPAGRSLGARNRLNKALIEDLYAEWKEPAQFVK